MKVYTVIDKKNGLHLAYLVIEGIEGEKPRRVLLGRRSDKAGAEFLVRVFDGAYMNNRKPATVIDLINKLTPLSGSDKHKVRHRAEVIYD